MALLEMTGITKIYPNVIANDQVDFSLEAGEIHALMGENGAGKSTLMKILFGMEQADSGAIKLDGESVQIDSPMKALSLGIGMVHQHFMLVENHTVAENLVLGDEPGLWGFWDKKASVERVRQAAEKYRFQLDPEAKIKDLSVGARQKVEILKCLMRGSKILILDEPTAVLAPQETEELFAQLLKLKEMGHSIVFISHKLGEIKSICDRMTIMRKGASVGVYPVGEVTAEEISRLMIGRVVNTDKLDKQPLAPGKTLLEAKKLSFVKDGALALKQVSLSVRAGEIVGIAGVEGNGQYELLELLTGMAQPQEGEIYLDGANVTGQSVHQLRQKGLAHIPEDRLARGSARMATIWENLIANEYRDETYRGKLWLDHQKIRARSAELIAEYSVKTDSPNTAVTTLSGGNIQKVVVARETYHQPNILVANQPTRGIDVGAAMFIRQKMVDLRDAGTGILLHTTDMAELLALSDRIIVLYGGEITAHFSDITGVNEETIGRYMLGLEKMEEEALQI